MFGDESIARECFKCINGLRYFSLWRVNGDKLGQVYKTFNPSKKMFHATDIFTKTNRTNQIGKCFHPGMFDPASPQNSRDSIIVIVVLSARVPGQTLLIKLRIENIDLMIIMMTYHLDLLIIILIMVIVSPWWQSEEYECWPPWLAQDLLHHFPSTAKHHYHCWLEYRNIINIPNSSFQTLHKVCFIASLPLQNIIVNMLIVL